MDFFGAQDAARRKTWQLGALFTVAVVALIVLTNVLLGFAAMMLTPSTALSQTGHGALAAIPWENWALISTGVIGVVGCASLYKFLTLRGGGKTVAEALGGTLLTHAQASGDLQSKRLLNIVEEMAIASGTPVPPVYLIEEPSINAFAAGFTLDDAVIGINRGTIDNLSRDELQGVVAHEFSHITNGDMRLNLRLIAALHGILFLGMIGYGILRGGRVVRSSRDRGGIGPLLLVGVGLVVIGYGGTFFGKWIKSAVSRQREYLADAAAVQFTRNPQGIAGALKKIGGSMYGSTIPRPAAEEASHLFFGDVVRRSLGGLFATHPPLEKRIRAIEPGWDGSFQTSAATDVSEPAPEGAAAFAGAPTPDEIVAQVGESSAVALDDALVILDRAGETLTDAAHDPYTARALIYAMLLPDGGDTHALAERHSEHGVTQHVIRLHEALAGHDALERVGLIELAVPTLKSLSAAQYRSFMNNVRSLVNADQRVDLFEWVLYRVLSKSLRAQFETVRAPRVRYRHVEQARAHIQTVLSALLSVNHADSAAQSDIRNEVSTQLGFEVDALDQTVDLARLNEALVALRGLHPLSKPKVLKAAASIVTARFTAEAGALLHGIAATLDCPLPLSAATPPELK